MQGTWAVSALASIKRLFAVPEDPELVLAQARALSRQVPLMYAMLMVNTLILAATHVGIAPTFLTIYVPAALTLVSIWRVATWWSGRGASQNVDQARGMIVRMMRVMPFLAVAFSAWTIALLPYGDAYEQSQVVFFCGITTIGCMFCLMHVRAAALTMGALALVPFSLLMLSMGNPVLTAIAFNLAAVVMVMLFVLLGNYRDFAALVASRTVMAQKQAETQSLSDKNDQLANVDTLTGLPNRRSFDRHLEILMGDGQIEDNAIAVVRLDLDSFKSINEIYGQITGDRVLVEVARRLTMLRPPGAFIARLGADNFAMVLSGPVAEESLAGFGAVLCRTMRSSFELKNANIHLSASVGLAAVRADDTAEAVYDRADYVTSLAKRDCRGSAVVFGEGHEVEIRKVRRMEHALRHADLQTELTILFQPQFDTTLNCTTGYEVLARWHSPVLGQVSPVEFIPLAERTGLICQITQTVLAKALAAAAKLPKHIRLSVNLSANDIGSTTATEAIVEMVQAAGSPCRIDFEITETAIMRDMRQASEALATLLALGSRISLDDFGTGHSSLTHVQKLPLDRIKIDRSFVGDIANDATSRAIIKTMVDMCRNLGISCVMEGVETQDQLSALKELGGSLMQGYLFGRPVDEATMQKQVASEQASWGAGSIPKLGATN